MPFYKGKIWAQTRTQGEGYMKMRAEVTVMHLQAKGHHRLPAMPEAGGEAWNRLSLTATEGTKRAGAVTSASQPPERREDTLLLVKAPICGNVSQKPREPVQGLP